MNALVRSETFYVSQAEPTGPLRELDCVELLIEQRDDDGEILPAGTQGTIVGLWGDGVAYEVDVSEPLMTSITVNVGNLRKIA